MTNIDYLKQDTQVGDIVIIELTSGKSVSGKLIEIGDYVIIEKEDGKRMRLLDGIIGGWEVLSHMRGDRKLNDYTQSNVDIIEEKDNNVVAKDNADGEKNEQINTDTDDGVDEYYDSEEEETYISEIAAAIKEDSSIGYSISYTKDEVREVFQEILNKANIDDTTFTPTNATITSIDSKSSHILARLDNGNVVRFTKSTLVGFNLIRDNLVGSRLFCSSSGATESIINSKRNIAFMSYGQLRVIFLTALDQVNFTLLRRICRTMNKFGQRRNTERIFTVDELAILRCLETETAHTGYIFYTHKIVERGQFMHRAFFFSGYNLFTPIKQQSSPTVRQSIAETAKDVPLRLCVLPPGIIIDISTQG